MWRVYKKANRPWPVICPDDDVLDYMIMEAVALKEDKEEAEAAKRAEADRWKKQTQQELVKQHG